VVRAVEGV